MPYPEIIPYEGEIPLRDQGREELNQNTADLLTYIPPFVLQVNAAGQYIDQATGGIQQSTEEATAASEEAQGAAGIALSLANFVGRWVDIEGTLAVPASTYHNGQYWALLEDIADVQAEEPGVSAVWASTASLQGEATGPINMAGFEFTASNINASTYDLAGGDPGTTTLDLADQQVFELENPTSLAIDFINLPAAGRGKPIIVRIDGPGSVTFSFPGFTIDWEGGGAENTPPDVGEAWTTWRFMFTGSKLSGGNFKG